MASSDGDTVTWHEGRLPRETREALRLLKEREWFATHGWYLAGGTALALQVGHRESVDLDFFTREKTFSPAEVLAHVGDGWRSDVVEDRTIYGHLGGARVSFIAHPFFVPRHTVRYGALSVLRSDDVAVMKIVAISQRGRRRDFVDLYWCANNLLPLSDILKRLPEQYPSVAHDYHHILKSLLFFDDAEDEPMPTLHFNVTWGDIKTYFRREVPKVTRELLDLL